jgi:hypothetical protein
MKLSEDFGSIDDNHQQNFWVKFPKGCLVLGKLNPLLYKIINHTQYISKYSTGKLGKINFII